MFVSLYHRISLCDHERHRWDSHELGSQLCSAVHCTVKERRCASRQPSLIQGTRTRTRTTQCVMPCQGLRFFHVRGVWLISAAQGHTCELHMRTSTDSDLFESFLVFLRDGNMGKARMFPFFWGFLGFLFSFLLPKEQDCDDGDGG